MIEVTVERGRGAGDTTALIKSLQRRFPGNHEMLLKVGASRLRLGPSLLYADSEACLTTLSEIGTVTVS